MYACMHAWYMHACLDACMHAWMHVSILGLMYMYTTMRRCMDVCKHACMHACSFVSLYVDQQVAEFSRKFSVLGCPSL